VNELSVVEWVYLDGESEVNGGLLWLEKEGAI
jgi:hypothetical protein